MTGADLKALRKAINLTQIDMAKKMGLGTRAYQIIEQAEVKNLLQRHVMLANLVSLDRAIDEKNSNMATPIMRSKALELMRLITGR